MSELKDRIMTIPWLEMTGNRLKATEVSMYALRLIKKWDVFADKLPAPDLIFKRITPQCRFKLMPLERQLWQHIDSLNSLNTIAKQINKPIQSIQVAAFRLVAVGLIEEIILPSLTLEASQLNSSANNLRELSISNAIIKSEQQEPAPQENRQTKEVSQAKLDFQPDKEISITNFSPLRVGDRQTESEVSESDAHPSLLDNVLGLLRSQFKNS